MEKKNLDYLRTLDESKKENKIVTNQEKTDIQVLTAESLL